MRQPVDFVVNPLLLFRDEIVPALLKTTFILYMLLSGEQKREERSSHAY